MTGERQPDDDSPDRGSDAAPERLIVDGLNVLGSRPDGWWRDRPRAMSSLVERLVGLADARDRLRIEVVFDGRPHARVREAAAGSAVEVRFAGGGRDAADREIAARVRSAADPGEILVATSDRRLAAAVKAAGGRSLGAGEFLKRWLGP